MWIHGGNICIRVGWNALKTVHYFPKSEEITNHLTFSGSLSWLGRKLSIIHHSNKKKTNNPPHTKHLLREA